MEGFTPSKRNLENFMSQEIEHTHTHTRVNVCACVYVYVFVNVCACVCMSMSLCVYVCTGVIINFNSLLYLLFKEIPSN